MDVDFGWSGEFVRLVPRDKDKHFENIFRWINDPEVTRNLTAPEFPVTRMEGEERFQQSLQAKGDEVAFAIELLSGEHIGITNIHHINHKDGSAVTGIMIGAKEHWGKGFGTDAARVRTRYCFEVLGLRYLMSSALGDNDRSLGMLKRLGYEECGRYPNLIWRRGQFVDQVLLYLTREMWEAEALSDER